MRKQNTVYRLAIDAMLAGLYIILAYFTIKIQLVEIAFTGIVVIIAALLYSPVDGVIVALIGSFVGQLTSYGLTPTTILWMLAPMLRGLMIGIFAWASRRGGRYLEENIPLYVVAIVITGLCVTAVNTGAIYLDGIIMQYPVKYTALVNAFRFVSSTASAVVHSIIIFPIIKALTHVHVFRLPKSDKYLKNALTAQL